MSSVFIVKTHFPPQELYGSYHYGLIHALKNKKSVLGIISFSKGILLYTLGYKTSKNLISNNNTQSIVKILVKFVK